jgi:superfamily I DNA/RNA helicase
VGYLSGSGRSAAEGTLALRFTSSQWDAVRSVDRHVLVAAGAGTGKTNTVVGRILYLLGVPINGQSVTKPLALRDLAAITFTNAAAADLKRKIREALRSVRRYDTAYLVDTARMGTIHSFCSDVLREVALRTGGNPGDEIVDEVSSLGLMAQVARDSVVAGIESGSVEGLDELLETWSVREVERFVTDLLRDLDRLRVLRQFRHEMNVREAALVELAGQAAAPSGSAHGSVPRRPRADRL